MKYCNDIRAIADIVEKLNRAKKEKYYVDKCDKVFEALEIIFDIYIDYALTTNSLSNFAKQSLEKYKPRPLAKNKKLSETTNSLLKDFQKDELLRSKYFIDILHFRPFIMSDNILEKARYNPSSISAELKKKASINHQKLIDNYNRNARQEIIISSLCSLIYEIRSNLKHYGKTPNGPDLEKSKRDELICELVYPLLVQLLEYFLNSPNHKLIVYGTLMENGMNTEVLKDIQHNIIKVGIWGYIEKVNNLPYYTFTISNSETITAELILDPNLKNHFSRLDRFEGDPYRRILVPYQINNDIQVGNIYEKNSA